MKNISVRRKNVRGSLLDIDKSILLMLESGYTKNEIAHNLGINAHTIDGYLRRIYKILGVHSKAASVAKAIRGNLI